jgi:hypothetical protein
MERCRGLFQKYDYLQSPQLDSFLKADTYVIGVVQGLCSYAWNWGRGLSDSRAEQGEVLRRAIHKELRVYKKKLELMEKMHDLFDITCIGDTSFIDKVKFDLVAPTVGAGAFLLQLHPFKTATVQKTRALLFYLSRNLETQKQFENFLAQSKGEWGNKDKITFLQQKIFNLAKGSFIAKESEPNLSEMLSIGATLLQAAYEFWNRSEIKDMPLEDTLWVSACDSFNHEDHVVLVQDLAEYCVQKDRNSFYYFLFPEVSSADNKLFKSRGISKELVFDLIDDLLEHHDITKDTFFVSIQKAIKQKLVEAYEEVEKEKNQKISQLNVFYDFFTKSCVRCENKQEKIKTSYLRQYNNSVIEDFARELELAFDKVFEDYEVCCEDVSWESELEQKYYKVVLEHENLKNIYTEYNKRCNRLWKNFMRLPPKFTASFGLPKKGCVLSSFAQQLPYDIPIFGKGFFAWLFTKVTLPVEIGCAEYRCREAMTNYAFIKPHYEQVCNSYRRNCQWYTIVVSAKKRLREQMLKA